MNYCNVQPLILFYLIMLLDYSIFLLEIIKTKNNETSSNFYHTEIKQHFLKKYVSTVF